MQTQSIELEETVNNALQHFLQQDQMNWNIRSRPDKWSKNELLGHLIDSANNNIQRFVRGTYEEKFKVIYHQDDWVNIQHYNEASSKDLIQLWHLLNLQIIRILKHYPPERKEILCDTGKQEITFLTMDFLATDYISHLEYHLKQLYH